MSILTDEQKKQIPAFKSEFRSYGLSTEPADMPRLTAAITRAYRRINRDVPPIFLVASPMEACEIIARENKTKLAFVNTSLWGQVEMYWIAVYTFPERHMQKKYTPKKADGLDIMREIGMSCSWWYPYEHGCIVCDRPSSIVKDEERRLHNASGPAVQFRDGFSMYCWHGTRVPKEWIIDRTLTAKQALQWKNTDQRTAACQILGWAAILGELDAKIIDHDPNPYIGTLYSAQLPDQGEQRFLKARCGTGVDVVILASNSARTAREAGAISYGCTEDQYDPTFRT